MPPHREPTTAKDLWVMVFALMALPFALLLLLTAACLERTVKENRHAT